ncbi:MAG: DUF1559 domain-containing protein [Planctomycetes bacterium]|nr:DUF1559 domain-containing protein [Planctomycetota bacterium]
MRESNSQIDAQLLGFLVGGLEEKELRQVEADLEAHPERRLRLDKLRLALDPLAADKDEPAPPRGLAVRTIALIAEHSCRQLPRAPATSRQSGGGGRTWWRRADVLVAACLLLTFLGLGIPAVVRMRAGAARVECQNNLRTFGFALQNYHELRGHYPNIAEEAPHNVAGMVIPILADAGVLKDTASIRCAGNGAHLANSLTLDEARAIPPENLDDRRLTPSYAFSLGFKDDTGYHPPCQCEGQPANLVALMSDGPPLNAGAGNSPNHRGDGQNVLFIDGSVGYYKTRNVGFDNDIFTNKAKQVAAGLDCLDIVLGRSLARP